MNKVLSASVALLVLMTGCISKRAADNGGSAEAPVQAVAPPVCAPKPHDEISAEPIAATVADLKDHAEYFTTGQGAPPLIPDSNTATEGEPLAAQLATASAQTPGATVATHLLCPFIGDWQCALFLAAGITVIAKASLQVVGQVVGRTSLSGLIIPASAMTLAPRIPKTGADFAADPAFMDKLGIFELGRYELNFAQVVENVQKKRIQNIVISFYGNGEFPSIHTGEIRLANVVQNAAEQARTLHMGLFYPHGPNTAQGFIEHFQGTVRHILAETKINPGRVLLFGNSMGGAMATHVAADLWSTPQTKGVSLITDRTFSDLNHLVSNLTAGVSVLRSLVDGWGNLRPPYYKIPENKQFHIFAGKKRDRVIASANTENYQKYFSEAGRQNQFAEFVDLQDKGWTISNHNQLLTKDGLRLPNGKKPDLRQAVSAFTDFNPAVPAVPLPKKPNYAAWDVGVHTLGVAVSVATLTGGILAIYKLKQAREAASQGAQEKREGLSLLNADCDF